ncbi:amidohydrolase family protein [Tsukamurella asaccharolytica]|uniref:Amidohydrolase family protein n=1 Tax=Tsukamurella asaccharolytica TaxID=2592067 RepID=A0A5C5RDL7_9ACTN|nr:amidohydrolase family protein [Tsukamurella asaccharolytica]TWS20503.1 amidohydrolase family protein [Tsukamurella asaccharolytica]
MTIADPADTDYWIVGARIVDGTGAEPVDGCAVHVENGTITEVGRAPSRGATLDASGLTLTPGLIDAHVHLGLSSDIAASMGQLSVAEIAADMFDNCSQTLDSGFTTVRDTGGIDAGLANVVAAGKVRGPRILQCGPIQCQTGGHGHFAPGWEPADEWHRRAIPGLRDLSMLSDGVDEMRKNVREAFRRGAQFLKLCVTGGVVSMHDKLTDVQFSQDEIAAAVAEAKDRATYVTVHAHNNDGIRRAVAAGVTCVEHGSDIDEATAAVMADNAVALVPTLSVTHALANGVERSGLPESIGERLGSVMQGQIDGLLAARAAGVRVGSGSDLIGPDQRNRGFELQLRSSIETPLLALRSATQINADILGIGDRVGTIEAGKQADLAGFFGDPIERPEVFGDPAAVRLVIQNGRIVKNRR